MGSGAKESSEHTAAFHQILLPIYINNFGKCGHRRAVGVRVGTHMKHVITDKREVGLL